MSFLSLLFSSERVVGPGEFLLLLSRGWDWMGSWERGEMESAADTFLIFCSGV